MNLLARAALLIPAVLLLSACSSGADKDATVATVGPDGWRVTEAGFGPLLIGQSVSEAAAAIGGTFSAASGAPAECSYAEWPSAPAGVRVMLVNDTVARVDVNERGVSTAGGARIGDTEGRIGSLYTGKVLMAPHKYTTGKYLVITPSEDTMRRIVFETDGQVVTEYRAGREPEVQWVERCG